MKKATERFNAIKEKITIKHWAWRHVHKLYFSTRHNPHRKKHKTDYDSTSTNSEHVYTRQDYRTIKGPFIP